MGKFKFGIKHADWGSIFLEITQGFAITPAKLENNSKFWNNSSHFLKITQATGGLSHSQPPEKCTKEKPVLLPPFENGNLMPSHLKGKRLLKNFTDPKNSLRT